MTLDSRGPDDNQPIGTEIELSFEYSSTGRRWERHPRSVAREWAVNIGELRALVSVYTRWLGPCAQDLNPLPIAGRLVVEGCLTGRVLAVVMTRLVRTTGDYEPTGEAWSVLDSTATFDAWQGDLAAKLIAASAPGETPPTPHVLGLPRSRRL